MMKCAADGWIFCCGGKRSGSTLHYQMVAELVERAGTGRRLPFAAPEDFPAVRDAHDGEPGVKVFKSHRLTPEMAALFDAGRAAGVRAVRDVRDALVSLMGFRGRAFDDLVPGFVRRYVADDEQWRRYGDRVHVARYEDFAFDLATEARRLAGFLGLPADEAALREVAAALELARQRDRVPATAAGAHDPRTLLHAQHIQSGEAGRWRTELSARQIALVEQIAAPWLVDNGYELQNDDDYRAFRTWAQGAVDCIAWRYFDRRPGWFVDVGAFDGVHLSNTFALEAHGWRGLCVEAHPDYAALLRRNRPEAICVEAAVTAPGHAGRISFNAEPLGLFSGLAVDEAELAGRYERSGLPFDGVHPTTVTARTLDEILTEHARDRTIDLLSIDVEGTELDVLRGVDLARWRPGLIVAEANDDDAARRLAAYLAAADPGYVLARRRAVNLFFVPDEASALRLAAIVPVCRTEPQPHPVVPRRVVTTKLFMRDDRGFPFAGADDDATRAGRRRDGGRGARRQR